MFCFKSKSNEMEPRDGTFRSARGRWVSLIYLYPEYGYIPPRCSGTEHYVCALRSVVAG